MLLNLPYVLNLWGSDRCRLVPLSSTEFIQWINRLAHVWVGSHFDAESQLSAHIDALKLPEAGEGQVIMRRTMPSRSNDAKAMLFADAFVNRTPRAEINAAGVQIVFVTYPEICRRMSRPRRLWLHPVPNPILTMFGSASASNWCLCKRGWGAAILWKRGHADACAVQASVCIAREPHIQTSCLQIFLHGHQIGAFEPITGIGFCEML